MTRKKKAASDPLAPLKAYLKKEVAKAEREVLESMTRVVAMQCLALGMSKGKDHLVNLLTGFLTPEQIEGVLSVCVTVHEEIRLQNTKDVDAIKTSRRLLKILSKEKIEQLDAMFHSTGVISVEVGHA